MRNPNAQMQIDIEHSKVDISSRLPRIQIDQQQCFNESGIMDPSTLTDHIANQGAQAAFQGIDRRVSEGNRIAAIENGGNPIAQIAKSNSFDQLGYTIAATPRSRPRVMVNEGFVDIRVQEGYVSVNGNQLPVQINYQRGYVDISI